MKKFALLVGNGFTLDLTNTYKSDLNSSNPLKNFDSLDISYSDFIDYLPSIKKDLLGQDISDYQAINNFVLKHKTGSREECELRRFLAISYSIFQTAIDKYDLQQWKWVKWLTRNKRNLICSVSFNYDKVLERTLLYAGIQFNRVGSNEIPFGVPVLKPHGSIDFDIPNFIGGLTGDALTNFIWKSLITTLNDNGSVEVVPQSRWLFPRTEADIIPPSVFNIQRHLSWVDSMFNLFETRSSDLDALVIVGSSYWDVDRPEIDFFLEKLPKNATVYIANPEPNRELVKKLASLGLPYVTFGFDELPW